MKSGDVIVSMMGDENDGAKGGFVVLDGQTWKIKGSWNSEDDVTPFGYDFWYQYKFNVMISSEFGSPCRWWKCFNPADVPTDVNINTYNTIIAYVTRCNKMNINNWNGCEILISGISSL
ncbi:SELENBP1 [Bugula neritina]|uniref:SELENBP1 n=1 Tax=Bugula neritina TaxID=10212 RepID=A0A7J7KK85_BUGNE|nr:SELENBP1 [Bugula neritina]